MSSSDKSAGSALDPVCGMTVNAVPDVLQYKYKGEIYYFCSSHCLEAFRLEPERYLIETAKAESMAGKGIYEKMRMFMSIALVLWLAGFASAAEPGHSHTMTPEMRRQHNSMSVTQKQWTACKKYLGAGDFTAAGASLAQMQKAAGYLEKFKLHKNSEMTGNFKEQADNFRKNLSELRKAIKDKDKARTQSLSKTIDNGCVQCHTVFR